MTTISEIIDAYQDLGREVPAYLRRPRRECLPAAPPSPSSLPWGRWYLDGALEVRTATVATGWPHEPEATVTETREPGGASRFTCSAKDSYIAEALVERAEREHGR